MLTYTAIFFIGFTVGFCIQAVLTTSAQADKPSGEEFDEHEGLGL